MAPESVTALLNQYHCLVEAVGPERGQHLTTYCLLTYAAELRLALCDAYPVETSALQRQLYQLVYSTHSADDLRQRLLDILAEAAAPPDLAKSNSPVPLLNQTISSQV